MVRYLEGLRDTILIEQLLQLTTLVMLLMMPVGTYAPELRLTRLAYHMLLDFLLIVSPTIRDGIIRPLLHSRFLRWFLLTWSRCSFLLLRLFRRRWFPHLFSHLLRATSLRWGSDGHSLTFNTIQLIAL